MYNMSVTFSKPLSLLCVCAYLSNDTKEGLRVEEGTQPVGGHLGHTHSKYLIHEHPAQSQVRYPLSQRPAGGRSSHTDRRPPEIGDRVCEE